MNKQLARVETLLTSYARTTFNVMMRLNALEKAMKNLSPKLWARYLKQYDLERTSPSPLAQQRALRAETELDLAIAELRTLLQKNEKIRK